ncbi:MAG: YIP1 family protein [Defluviitaleaceae bacterium]|nr:YIP1 family protein [Defluviitaleaceae bacterium]
MVAALKYQFYILFRPIDGFYRLKNEKRGRNSITILNLFLFWVSYSFMESYVSFTVAVRAPAIFRNSLINLLGIVAIFLLFCIGNWAVTTLMNGEGKFSEICMAVSYALFPMLLIFIPATLLSHLLTSNEAAFYTILVGASIFWFAILMFLGILVMHDYTVFKTIMTFFLTILSMLIIMFLIMLVTTLTGQLWIFLRSVYTEIVF